MATSLATLRTNAQRYADLDSLSTGPVTTATWTVYLNSAYFELWDLVAQTFGDHFLTSADFTIAAAGDTYTLPTGLRQVRGVDRDPSNTYPTTVAPFGWGERNSQVCRSYKLRGAVLEIRPKSLSTGDYRIWYTQGATALSADGDEIDAQVDYWHDYIEIRAAMFALVKQEQDATHLERLLSQYAARIQSMARTRDASAPPTATATRAGDLNHYHWVYRWGS